MQNFCNHPGWNAELCRALCGCGERGHELGRKSERTRILLIDQRSLLAEKT